jgi:hypothetical protein
MDETTSIILFLAIVLTIATYLGFKSKDNWEEMREKEVPMWLKKAAKKGGVHFKGRTFVYKVLWEPMEQGCYVPHYYKKLRL